MNRLARWRAAFALAMLLITVRPAAAAPIDDELSYAQPDVARVSSVTLDLAVDFERHVLSGTAELRFAWLDARRHDLVLDTRDLTIQKVELLSGSRWTRAAFELAPPDPVYGSKLTIHGARSSSAVRIAYATSPAAGALQWLTPQMTQGRRYPFLFSQSQSIQARSWVPLQDRPDVRFTYQAHVRTPPGVIALMSASNDPKARATGDYHFVMPNPIPSYLLAIVVGDLEFRPVSARSGIWAEPEMAERAAKEFEDTERMMAAAESFLGAYRWGRFDLLVAPPSFPLGGMENPRLVFLTPTVIVGDKSLVSVVAHELAHSWSGNLVSNGSWKDVWLNEGLTTYVQGRIVEMLYGKDAADMEDVLDQADLAEALGSLPPSEQLLAQTAYADDWLTPVPYVKGKLFFQFLEERVGRPALDTFLRAWTSGHAFQSVRTDEFERFVHAQLLSAHPGAVSDADLKEWLHAPGLPASAHPTQSKALSAVSDASAAWRAGRMVPAGIETSGWRTQQWVYFIDSLKPSQPPARLEQLDLALHLSGASNGEIASHWYVLSVQSHYLAGRDAMRRFLTRVGRPKFVVPIYRALAQDAEGHRFAEEVFSAARSSYHPNTVKAVEKVLAGGR